ncbi:ABC transporter substrate-binding protein [Sinanaerobacter sp. ZZT-01]|uniref:ABC transporter substrate-binding protein n=1 Tax=Sinanaerobacter sp. ZZT-01 TaxID=3111540 RepID=UPI002D76E016|nr:ABC transporter substrate-binding protein [Sinanaerobacter sp. ZZT-01]WRR93454.1 ABC transporter substrate-binding protein [Sinanaerobacter sp. ZZT-01]
MKKFMGAGLVFLLMISMALTGCGGNDDKESTDAIKVGLNYELSGDVATYGQSSVDGIKMAVEEINAAGGVLGKQIELVEVDNKSDASEVVSVATKLMSQENVVAVIGPATSGNYKAQEPIATQYGIPILSGSATADDVTVGKDGVKDYVFRLCFSDSFQGTAMATYAKDNLEATKAVIIKDSSSDYAAGLADNFRATFEKNGGKIVTEEAYAQKEKDFNAILTKIKKESYDVIFLPGYYQEAGLIIKQARDLGITAPILGADGFDSPKLKDLAGTAALNDVYYSNHYSSLDKDPAVAAFIGAFNKKYNKEPDAFNALGYDCGKFIADAITRAGEANPEKIKEALASTENFSGVTGSFSIDENHNPVKSIVVIKLTDGEQSSSEKVGL